MTPEWRPRISRAKAALITEIWPGLSADLLAYLRGRRVRADEAEDIVQEVAARLLAKPVRFSTADELWPWAVTVAHNLAADRWRSEQRVAFVPDRLDAPDRLDVSAQAEDRVVLAAVQGALSKLSVSDRQAILGPSVAPALDRPAAVKLAVRRHRARGRLMALVGGVAAYIALLLRRLRQSPTPRVVLAGAVAVLTIDGGLIITSRMGPDPASPRSLAGAGLSSAAAPRHERPAADASSTSQPGPTRGTGGATTAVRPTATGAARRTAANGDGYVVPAPNQEVRAVTPVSERETVVGTRPRKETDHLVCVGFGTLLPETCVG